MIQRVVIVKNVLQMNIALIQICLFAIKMAFVRDVLNILNVLINLEKERIYAILNRVTAKDVPSMDTAQTRFNPSVIFKKENVQHVNQISIVFIFRMIFMILHVSPKLVAKEKRHRLQKSQGRHLSIQLQS